MAREDTLTLPILAQPVGWERDGEKGREKGKERKERFLEREALPSLKISL